MSAATTTSNPESPASETAAQPVSIGSLTLEVPDPQEARAFYSAAFDLGIQLDVLRLRRAHERLSRLYAVARRLPAGDRRRADQLRRCTPARRR